MRPLLTLQDRRVYALILVEAGHGDEAERWLQESLSVFPSDDDVRLALAGLHASRGEWETALTLYGAVLQRRPENGSLNLVYGEGLLSLGNYKAAVKALEKASRAAPSNRQAALAYARALRGAGDLKRADRVFEKVMVLGETDAPGVTPSGEVRDAASDPKAMPDVGLPSIVEPPELSRFVIDLRHPLRTGTLRVFVDEGKVLERSFGGSVTKSILGIKLHGGRARQALPIKPGQRRLKIQVRWEERESSAVIEGGFKPGATRRLSVRMGRLNKDLKLEWE